MQSESVSIPSLPFASLCRAKDPCTQSHVVQHPISVLFVELRSAVLGRMPKLDGWMPMVSLSVARLNGTHEWHNPGKSQDFGHLISGNKPVI